MFFFTVKRTENVIAFAFRFVSMTKIICVCVCELAIKDAIAKL